MLHAGVIYRDVSVGAVNVAPVLVEYAIRRSPEAFALMLRQHAQMQYRNDRARDAADSDRMLGAATDRGGDPID